MKVWMFPKTNKENPYNNMLSSSIEKYGVNVTNFRQRNFLDIKKNEILHLHWPHSLYQSNSLMVMTFKAIALILVLSVLKLKGSKIVWTLHNLYPHKYKYKFMEKIIRKKIISISNLIITAGEFIKKEAINEFNIENKHIEVIPIGNYVELYNQERSMYDIRQKYNIPEKNFIFLFCGAIKEYKGVIELLESFIKLKEKKNNISLIIAGKPDYFMNQKLNKYLGTENIYLDLRFIPDDELSTLLDNCNAVVLPFKNITTSSSAILALSFYKPIVALDAPFFREYFDDNTSVLFNNIGGLSYAMEKIMKLTIDKSTFDKRIIDLDWERIGNQMKKIYLGLYN
ncbi:glycosyltransferase family 4 protein [Bacillus sp. NEB1478]|uniref:glycosyltransferase family 4 protein n=1 Tax=Bacillus sp. NEB1478 TaxID=3073816 RepID=UPI0028732495|nr:glycosyltransferase family 4 protein [Bacillus sp. NEB1478]WNB92505.1 glycosyltransferase family 4 protein [Bacillus sp. NEB1478]